MNSQAEVFDKVYDDRGGRLKSMPDSLKIELINVRARLQMWTGRLTHNLKAQNMPVMYLDLIPSPNFNAVATEQDGCGYVGLYAATPIIIGDLFGRMLSHSKVLPTIGNASVESLAPEWQYGIYPGANDFQSRFWCGINADEDFAWVSVPKDRVRRKVAGLCSTLVMDFLCLHELAHVGYGHTTYLKAKHGMPFLLEADPSDYSADTEMTRQSLEMSADALAASLSLNAFLKDRQEIIKSEPELELISDDETAIFLWTFACGTLFFMFSPTCDINALESLHHPPAAMRLRCNINCALDNIANRYERPEDVFQKAINAIGDIAIALRCIGEKDSLLNIQEQIKNGDRLNDHRQKIVLRFEDLKSELKPFSHFTLEELTPPG